MSVSPAAHAALQALYEQAPESTYLKETSERLAFRPESFTPQALVMARAQVANIDPENLRYLGGDAPLFAQAALATRSLEAALNEINRRARERLFAAVSVALNSAMNDAGRLARARLRDIGKNDPIAEAARALMSEDRSLRGFWPNLPTAARAELTPAIDDKLGSRIPELIEDEAEEIIAEAQEEILREIARSRNVSATALRARARRKQAEDRARAVEALVALAVVTARNRFTNTGPGESSDDRRPITRGVIVDVLSMAGGVDNTPQFGIARGPDVWPLAGGRPARGEELGFGDTTVGILEDIEEARTGTRQSQELWIEFTHVGGENDNELHVEADGRRFRAGERERVMRVSGGSIVRPGQFPGCDCYETYEFAASSAAPGAPVLDGTPADWQDLLEAA